MLSFKLKLKLLLNKTELFQSLESLSKSIDFRGVFVTPEYRERLKRARRLEEFKASELSKQALTRVAQIMYTDLEREAAETGLTIRAQTRKNIRGDLPPDLVRRLQEEMDVGADLLS